jgi:hypothetical protein
MNKKLLHNALPAVGIALLTIAGVAQAQTPLQPPKATNKTAVAVGTLGTPVTATNDQLKAATTIADFVNLLPNWGQIYPTKPKSKAKTGSSKGTEKGADGKNYDVTRTTYSLTETPQEIVTFDPVNGFWLGAVVQGQGVELGLGSLREVPVEASKRVGFKLTTDFIKTNNSRQISNPSASTVQNAIGSLVQGVSSKRTGSSMYYDKSTSFSEQQAALSVGLDAHYLTAQASAAIKTKQNATTHSVTAYFIERAFTVKLDLEGRYGASAFFNNSFTMDDADRLVDSNLMTSKNLPCYVNSVTYGRILAFTVTADKSESEITAAIDGSFNTVSAGASLDVNSSNLLNAESTHISIVSYGGTQDATVAMIKSGKLEDYFKNGTPLTAMKPISYTVNALKDNALACISRTTSYTASVYSSNSVSENYKIKMWFTIDKPDGNVFQESVKTYGEVRMNGTLFWSVPEGQAKLDKNKKKVGDTIDIVGNVGLNGTNDSYTFTAISDGINKVRLTGILKDYDSTSKDDILGNWNFEIDPKLSAGKGDQKHKGAGATLHVVVERI